MAFPTMFRHPGLESLEDRNLLSASVAPSYDEHAVLVRWLADTSDPGPLAVASEDLGDGLHRLALAAGVTVPMAVDYYRSLNTVAYAQPDYTVQVALASNDPSYASGSLWGLNNINAGAAWNTTTGTGSTIVAVIDTGVDYTHPDLNANMWRNPGEIPGNGRDDDGDGFIDDVYGVNFVNNSGNPYDDNNHGTHVAGIIGAVGNNGVGVTGVDWRVKIMALKFLDANGSGLTSNAVRALNFAVANGARVVNMSFSGGGFDQAMSNAIANARAKGVLVVAAAGNVAANNDVSLSYPANYAFDNIISVAAIDSSNRLATFSSYGKTTVDIAAPGVGILSTTRNNTYTSFSGTSMAAPYVAGAAALLFDLHPTWSYSQVINAILKTATPTASLAGKSTTGGRLNLQAAVAYGAAATPAPTPVVKAPIAVAATFTNATQAVIPDLGTRTSTITIGTDIKVADLNVKLNIRHTWDRDLVIRLTAPNGTSILLVNRRGGSGDNYTNAVIDDQASKGITSMAAPFTGAFKGESLLSAFNGLNAKGTWTLTIQDLERGDVGTLVNWSLILNGGTPGAAGIEDEPAVATEEHSVKAGQTVIEWVRVVEQSLIIIREERAPSAVRNTVAEPVMPQVSFPASDSVRSATVVTEHEESAGLIAKLLGE